MNDIGCAVERFDYDPKAVPLIDEFAAGPVVSGSTETCLVGRLAGRGEGRSLLLFAHPDPEPPEPQPGWRSDPFQPTLVDGHLHGWGVADDLTGIAMLLQGVHLLRAAGLRPRGDLLLVAAPSKQHRRGIAAALHRGVSADAAIYLHPAESGRGLDEIKAYAPGQLEFVITVEGQGPDTAEPAHTAFAHRAVNPFDKAMLIAAALKDVDEDRGRRVCHPVIDDAIGRSTNLMLSFCDFGLADKLSRIAPACRLGGAMTLVPGESLEDVMAGVEEAVHAVARRDGWLCDNPPIIEWLSGVSAAETKRTSDLYQLAAGILKRLGASPKINPLHTSSDIRNPIVQGDMPTIGFGPLCGGLTMAGETDEWVEVADYHRAITATASMIAEWSGVTRL
jgi:acetylornithine deacetylase